MGFNFINLCIFISYRFKLFDFSKFFHFVLVILLFIIRSFNYFFDNPNNKNSIKKSIDDYIKL